MNVIHGHRARTPSRTYSSWNGMMSRCSNPCATGYERYGGAGVSVCERWRDFSCFLADMGERPPGKSLDRYPDRKGSYEPSNCRWATPLEQAMNRDVTTLITYRGETRSLKAWATSFGMNNKTLRNRLRRGWTIDRALTTPSRLLVTVGGETKPLAVWCASTGVDYARAYQRLKSGWSAEQSIGAAHRKTPSPRQGEI